MWGYALRGTTQYLISQLIKRDYLLTKEDIINDCYIYLERKDIKFKLIKVSMDSYLKDELRKAYRQKRLCIATIPSSALGQAAQVQYGFKSLMGEDAYD